MRSKEAVRWSGCSGQPSNALLQLQTAEAFSLKVDLDQPVDNILIKMARSRISACPGPSINSDSITKLMSRRSFAWHIQSHLMFRKMRLTNMEDPRYPMAPHMVPRPKQNMEV